MGKKSLVKVNKKPVISIDKKHRRPDTELFDVDIHASTHQTLTSVWFSMVGDTIKKENKLYYTKADLPFYASKNSMWLCYQTRTYQKPVTTT